MISFRLYDRRVTHFLSNWLWIWKMSFRKVGEIWTRGNGRALGARILNYKNTSSPRGRVLVINNKHFGGRSDRFGTERDVAMLEKLFTGLHYKFVVKHDLKAQDIKEALKEESLNPEHKSFDSFVCVILSHGEKEIVRGTDSESVKYQEILSPFDNQSCPGLGGKPKLFFIQACQGNKTDDGAICTDEGESEEITDSPATAGVGDMLYVDAETHGKVILPTKSDILIAKATTEEYVSYRTRQKGTWFIQAIVKVFSQHACKEDVGSMLTKVNSHVSRLSTSKKKKQMSEVTHTLCKKMYFFPGNGKSKSEQPHTDMSSMLEEVPWKKIKLDSEPSLESPISIKPEVLTPRKYQKELAKPAMDGLNCIIYAPPNSGKTVVALMIAKNHLEKRCASTMTAATSGRDDDLTELKTAATSLENTVPKASDEVIYTRLKTLVNSSRPSYQTVPAVLCSSNIEDATELKAVMNTHSSKVPKVAFVTRRFTLLQQTFKHFKKYMPLWSTGKRSGGSNSNTPLSLLVQRKDVIIVVDNIMKDSLESKDVSIMDFSLIIFDECHHCKADNDHPYNQIMSFYIEQKLMLGETGEGKLPQIVGLTASPGGGRRPVAESVEKHILKLCANLDARRIVTVKDNLDELSQRKLEPLEQVCVEVQERENPFNDHLAAMMTQIESWIQISSDITKGTQRYMSFVEEKKKAFLEDDGLNTLKSLLCLDHLYEYNNAIEFCSSMRMEDALWCLKVFYNDMERNKRESGFVEMEKRLLTYFEDNVQQLRSFASKEKTPPKLKILKEQILTSQMKCEGNRAIIFVKTKKTAEAMKVWINSDTDLKEVNADVLFGTNTSNEKGGMSYGEQDAVLKKFKSGETKVLISTSVGGEGLHESNCGTVVIYDHMFDDVYSIQARGRARATKSTIAVIGAANTTAKHEVNVLLEQLTKMAVARIQQIPPEHMLQKINNMQHEDAHRRKQRREMMEEQKKKIRTDDINLICKGPCGKRVCKLSDIRKIETAHINPDPDFASNHVLFRDHHEPKKSALGIKKIHCKECEQDWGNTLQSYGYPCLKISAFYTEEQGVKKSRKKWSSVPFSIQKFYPDA
ncbi:interferon-induced helicase C domain-containing protein 1 isoform X2 [Lingula anatina]|uniref:RNA helicase n=1 Tax=Lingula anatina TaxID=7574 RepID=A0A1S3K0K1_LINAN|nr:interferon-induced helicase C domain-containing protein 1 isoform X2 [Lingula anatina]|eukprot:XP_013415811.1 interferon-induced helicase C domain-containing protein 1 isoform X2 [Lingula anatina]